MRFLRNASRCFVFLFISIPGVLSAQDAPFEIRDGDRVLLLGDTLLEREGTYGWIETRMHEQFPDRKFSVRNLAYSADTPRGISRSVFDPADKGWERLREQIAMVKPTVVVLGYGMASSMDFVGSPTDRMAEPKRTTEEKVARFRKELTELMDYIAGLPPASQPAGVSNDRASLSGTAVRGTATPAEASAAATTAEAAIASTKPNPRDAEGARPQDNAQVRFILLSPLKHEDLRSTKPGFPNPTEHNAVLDALSAAAREIAAARNATFISLRDASASRGVPITSNGIHPTEDGMRAVGAHIGSALGWKQPELKPEVRAAVRQAVQRKNELFFHRWRPQNQTYLFGFRKHEQGQNAKDIPMFDPFIEKADDVIDAAKRNTTAPSLGSPAQQVSAPAIDPATLPQPNFDVQEGYEITLWATNPLLEKPIQMNWDAQGRLWIASSRTYPQIAPGAQQEDRVIILEDSDRDGKADKSSVFSEGLLIPTGVVPDVEYRQVAGNEMSFRPSAYVAASTDLLRMVDTDRDGKADEREIVLSGFGTEDTHHILHTLRWGPDGRLYFNQSIYIHSHIETPWGVVRQNSGGVFAFDPRSQRLEVMYNGFWNPWGTAWDKWGQTFITDGAGFQGVSWGVRGAAYQTYEGSRRLLQSISPGTYPKFCGLELIYSPHFPQDWQGSAVTCDFRAHRVVRFGMQDLSTGDKPTSGYITKEMPDIVRTNDVSFRPIDVKLGPDGALYVADWSNPVINHGEVDFRDPRRDRTHGRIWRIARKGAPAVEWSSLAGKKSEELIPGVLDQSAWRAEQSRRVLSVRNDKATVASLGKWLQESPTEEVRREVHQLSTAWGADNGTGTQLELARSTSSDARAYAARTLDAREILGAKLAQDPNPRVRVQALRALAALRHDEPKLEGERVDAVLASALQIPENDPFYDYAAWLSVNDLAQPWTQAVLNGAWKIDSPEREKQLEFALSAIKPDLAGQVISRIVADRGIQQDGAGPWIELIGKAGGPNELRRLFDAAIQNTLTPDATVRALKALLSAAETRNVRPAGGSKELATALNFTSDDSPAPVAATGIRLLGAWKLRDATARALQFASGTDAGKQDAGFAALRAMGGDEALKGLRELTRDNARPDIQRKSAATLAALDLRGSWENIAPVLIATQKESDALTLWRALLAGKDAPNQLAALIQPTLPQPIAAAGLRAARETGKKGAPLVAALTPLAGAPTQASPTSQDYKPLAELVKRDGNPAEGERIFRRVELACVTCHAIGGAGGKVGPELTSLGASAPLDYIIESTLNPGVKVKEGYHAVNLTLRDGTVSSGVMARETGTEVILRNAIGQETAVPKANITGKEDIGSLMPAGLVERLSPREQLHLFAFMGQLGKPGVYDASKGAVVRMWKLANIDPANAKEAPATFVPALTNVDGTLAKDTLAAAIQMASATDGVIALARFQHPSAGTVRMTLTGVSKAWLNGEPLAIASEPKVSVELPAGEHTLAVKLDPKQLPEILRVESPDVRFLTE